MDISVEYVKMCKKAVEIQHEKPLIGDYVVIPNAVYEYFRIPSLIIEIDDSGSLDKLLLNVPDDNYVNADATIWLPRQDQLQGMVKDNYVINTGFYLYVKKFYNWVHDVDNPMPFTSMEQLWLAFLYDQKYNKTWSGSDWVSK